MKVRRQEIQEARNRVNLAKKRLQELEARLPLLKRQLQERGVTIKGLAERVASETRTGFQLERPTDSKANHGVDLRAELEQLRQDVMSTLEHTRREIEARCSGVEKQVQEHSIAIAGAVEQVEGDKQTVSQIIAETQERTATILQAQASLEAWRGELASTLQEIEGRFQEQYRNFETQLQSRESALQELAERVERDKTTVSQVLQETEIKVATIVQSRSELEELREQLVSTRQEIQVLVEEQSRGVESQLESNKVAIEELVSRVERDKTTVSITVQEAESITATNSQMRMELEQLRQDMVSVVNELGGKEGLESLRLQMQEGREVLSQMQMYREQLQLSAAPPTPQEQVGANQASLATQETASRVEQMREEVSSLAQQVRADKEAMQSWRASALDGNNLNAIDASVRELRELLSRLGSQLGDKTEDLGQKLQIVEQTMLRLRNGLWGVTLFCLGLALAFALALLK